MASKNFINAIIDEIALEGLDGITLQGLWLRLENRKDFGLKPVAEKVKLLIWEILIKARNVEFYLLPVARDPLEVVDRFSFMDEQGNYCEAPHTDRIYPHFPINDEPRGIMGSCEHYYTRKPISVRGMTLDEAGSHGNTLIVVADQKTRRTALCGTDLSPLYEMNLNNYCMLERVGRGRRNGDITHGKTGLQVISSDCKMLFYYRKCLLKYGLITSQTFHIKVKSQNYVGKIIHLKRFYVELKSKHATDAEKIIEHLKQQPEKFMLYKDLFKFDLKADVRKILSKHPKAFVTELVPYRKAFPDAPRSEWKTKTSEKEKNVRVVRLVESELRDEDEEEEEEENGILDEDNRRLGVPLLRQGYMALEMRGAQGLSQVALATLLGLTSLQGRSICKLLKKFKLCETMPNDVGRQRVILFYCKKYETLKHSMPSAIADEKSRLLQIVNSENDLNIPESIKRRERPMLFCEPPRKVRRVLKLNEEEGGEKKGTPSKKPFRDDMDLIQTEIEVSEAEQAKNVTLPTLLDGKSEKSVVGNSNNNLTLRILKRAGLILQAVNALKIIQDPQKLQRMINEEEGQEGFKYTIDRKTVLRLIDKLKADGHLKIIKVTLKGYGKEKVITFICHPSVNPDHNEIQAAIEQAKMKLPIITKEALDKTLVDNAAFAEKLIVDHKIGRMQYGYKPKFVRLRTMHFFIYYLVYGYTGRENLNQNVKQDMVAKYNLDPSIADEMSTIYHDTVDWKMFIPPLQENTDYPPGWVLVSELLVRLPLYVFVNLINVTYHVPKLIEYLEHPIRKYYLVKDLPTDISNLLTLMRKYLFTVSDIINQLAYIGLVQYGPQVLKEKDQVFIYLNRNAKLLDTTPSECGYNHVSKISYDERYYHFEVAQDLEHYWNDLWRFAMNTRLGNRNVVAGQTVVVESIYTKKQMLDALKAKSPEDTMTNDVGYLPGDNLGAAGLDSDLFVHLKRNWYWTQMVNPTPKANPGSAPEPPPVQVSASKLLRKSSKRKSRVPCKVTKNFDDEVVPKTSIPMSRLDVIKHKTVVKRKHRKQMRVMTAKEPRSRRPWYDEKDREALLRMKKLRVDWTPAEDNVLLLCKVAQIFMSYNLKCNFLRNFSLVRDILYKQIGDVAMNKTSRACQRRIMYMMKAEQTINSLDMCLEELRQDDELVARYGPASISSMRRSVCDVESGKKFETRVHELFSEFVELLLARLKSVGDINSINSTCIIPDTLDEFYTKFTVTSPRGFQKLLKEGYTEVQNTVDIMCSVMNGVMHSSLAAAHDKTNYSHQLFYIYQQYPDKLLRSVLTKCRNMGIIAMKKKSKRQDSRLVPINMSPFKLSVGYLYYLQSKFEYPIYHISFLNFSKVIEMSASDIAEIYLCSGGECANLIELYTQGFLRLSLGLPDQIIVLDPKLAETEEQYQQIFKRFKDLIASATSKKIGPKKLPAETDIEDEDIVPTDEDYACFLNSSSGLASAASRLALFMRDETTNVDSNIQHAHDYFVVNPCKIYLDFSGDSKDLTNLYNQQEVRNVLLEQLKQDAVVSEDFAPTPDDSEKELVDLVLSKRELGATVGEIKSAFGSDVAPLLISTIDKKILFPVGVVSLRIVHKSFLRHWLVRCFTAARSHRDAMGPAPAPVPKRKRGRPPLSSYNSNKLALPEVQVLIKPWIRIDGSVNRRVLDRLMGAVLCHILANPGILLDRLQTRFVPALQPMHTYFLVNYLEKIGCLKKMTLKSDKPLLWTERKTIHISETSILDDPKTVFLIPEAMAITKMGLFIGNKTYSEDYLQNYVEMFE